MLFSKPLKFKEALAARRVKKLMPTSASSAQLAAMEPQILRRSMFMARVNHTGMVGEVHKQIGAAMGDGVAAINPATARANLKLHLQSIGYDPEDPPEGFEPAKPGSLKDLSSDRRLDLVIDTNLKMIHGAGQFAKANDPDIIDAFPCWELYRLESRKEERGWRERWVAAGGKLYGPSARMIARKDDSIWSNLGPFKNPYPPFDYNSGMWTEDVDRAEAESLGVIKPSTVVAPQELDLNAGVSAAVPSNLPATLLDAVSTVLNIKDGRLVP